jgi:hypothetical protein
MVKDSKSRLLELLVQRSHLLQHSRLCYTRDVLSSVFRPITETCYHVPHGTVPT